MPTITRTTWVRKSATAKPMLTPADSFTPTMLSMPRRATTMMPAMMSVGDSPSGSQKTAR